MLQATCCVLQAQSCELHAKEKGKRGRRRRRRTCDVYKSKITNHKSPVRKKHVPLKLEPTYE